MTHLRLVTLAALLAGALAGCSRADPEPACNDGIQNGTESDVDCGGTCPGCGPGKTCSSADDCGALMSCKERICLPASCSDQIRNGSETDVDCGGSCPACASSLACQLDTDCASKICRDLVCAAPTCTDGVANGSESDLDCGGGCPLRCGLGKKCAISTDCTTGVCVNSLCVSPSCSDGIANGEETDVDCGGPCPAACADGKKCAISADCTSKICGNGICAPLTCTDGIKNGQETDLDCGGICPVKCPGGKLCLGNADCSSKVCAGGVCTLPACNDKIQNGEETDIDCGGAVCPRCAANRSCTVPADCESQICISKVCQPPSCNDGVLNGGEGDVDCGGSCPDKCTLGQKCTAAPDCASLACKGGLCVAPTCTDGVKNGAETDIDCGGTCTKKCTAGQGCGIASDCLSLVCTANKCVDTCLDGILNGTEGGVDCGGICPSKCVDGSSCKVPADCISKVCQNLLCQIPTCLDGVQNGSEEGIDCGGTCAACGGTCPMLYTWDGSRMQFESDMFPRGMLGLKYAAGYLKPNPNDYYMLRHQPAPRPDGLLDLRLVEERFEVDYLDQARLYTLDFAAGLDAYAEILFVGTSYLPPQQVIHTVTLPLQQPLGARHLETGKKVTALLGDADGQELVLGSDRNAASWNTIELDLGDLAAAPRIKLIIDARSAMPNTAAGSASAAAQELPGAMRTRLQVRDASGAWVDVPKSLAALPIPKEFPRPFVLDISGIFPAERQRVRLGFLYKTYLDAVRFDTSLDQPVTISEVPLQGARLDHHGISMPASASEMSLLIYDQVHPVKPFPYFPGFYTAYTEVAPLLASVDDKFVIFGPGDQIRLRYGPEPARAAGSSRRYLFYTHGYYKSDKAKTIPWTVEPLPFAAMSGFPYDPALESYPSDPAHLQYQQQYNTRKQ